MRRAGLISAGTEAESVIYKASELCPEFPGGIDFSCWEIGRAYCRPNNPNCTACIISSECKKIIYADTRRKDEYSTTFILNDMNRQVIGLLEKCINEPEKLVEEYEIIWQGQFGEGENSVDYYYKMREKFNALKNEPDAALTLFILVRVSKGAIRYNQQGEMNQICDRRRQGTQPGTIRKNALAISNLLKNQTKLFNDDYTEILNIAQPGDLVYIHKQSFVSGDKDRG
jgi:hypothetical protein